MRCIDLSHRLSSGNERFLLDIDLIDVGDWVPAYKNDRGDWYVMAKVCMCSHVGTHVEAPLHAVKGAASANQLYYTQLIGMASVVDFTDKKFNDPITKAEIAVRGTGIEENDIVLIKTGLSIHYGTKDYKRPYLETDAIQWLIEKKIKCLGVDCSGIENRMIDSHDINHHLLFENNIPLIEDLNNLFLLRDEKVFFIATTMNINGLDASLVRPIAVEPGETARRLYQDFFMNAEWVG